MAARGPISDRESYAQDEAQASLAKAQVDKLKARAAAQGAQDPVIGDNADAFKNKVESNGGTLIPYGQYNPETPKRSEQLGSTQNNGPRGGDTGSPRDGAVMAGGGTVKGVRPERSSTLSPGEAAAQQQIEKDRMLSASGGDVDALLAKRKDYTVPGELQNAYNQIQSQLNGDQDAYLKTRQDISLRKESQGLSNVYRNSTSGGDAQVGAGQVVAQYGQDSNEDVAADLQQKMGLRSQGLQASQALADEHNNQYIYNQQFPLEQRLAFLKQKKQNAANLQIADTAAGSATAGGVLSFLGNIASAALSPGSLLTRRN